MKDINWENVEELKEFQPIEPGGYIGRIFTVEDNPDKEYIMMSIDIAEGKYKDHFAKLAVERGYWALKLYRSYKESALRMFKAFKSQVEKSNPGYTFNNDETTLVDKYIGIILQEEEYIKNDGSVGDRIKIVRTLPVEDIRAGKFKVPEKTTINREEQKPTTPPADVWGNVDSSDEPTPFNS